MSSKLIGLLLALVLLGGVSSWMWSRQLAGRQPASEVFDTRIKCNREECAGEAVIKLPYMFDGFPIDCPKCGHRSAYLLTRCPGCQTSYANVDFRKTLRHCAKCGAELPPE
jgi:hypothetical protein